MTGVVWLIVNLIGSAMTLYGACYVLALSRPMLFQEFFASERVPKSKVRATLFYFLMLLKVIAIGKFFYHAASGMFTFVPAEWMQYDEDGETLYSTRGYLSVIFAVIATALVLDGERKVAAEGKRLLQERLDKWGY